MTTTRTSGEPRLAAIASWAVLSASFGLSAATWIAMARLAGFTNKLSLPLTDVTADLAWLMPVAVDGYVVVALVLWMAPVPARVAEFARVNTYAAAGVGIAAQSAYHAFTIWSAQPASDREIWRAVLAAIVGALPPAVAGLAVHMRALIRRESTNTTGRHEQPAPAASTVQPERPAPVEPPASAARPVVAEPAPAVDIEPPSPRPVVERPAPAPAPVEQPSALSAPAVSEVLPLFDPPPPAPARVPVSASAFTRHNGVQLTREVTR